MKNNVGKDVEKWEHYQIAGWNVKWCNHCKKHFGGSLKQLNIELPQDPAIPLLHIYPKQLKTGTQTNRCIYMFIAALFKISKRWKQLKYPSIGEWMNKMPYIHSIEYYSAIKMNKVLIHATPWMNLKNITLSEREKTQKAIYYMILLL